MKFCRFCGKQLGDDEVCDCEESKKAAENAESQGEAGTGAVIDNEKDSVTLDVSGVVEKAKSHKDLLIKIGCGVAVVILLLILKSLFSSSYKTPINNIVSAINKGTKADYLTLYNAGLPKNLAKLNKEVYTTLYEDRLDDKNDDIKDAFEDLKDKYPKFKIKFVYDSKEKLSKTELREFKDELEEGDFEDISDMIDEIEEEIDDHAEDLADMLDISESDLKKVMKDYIKYLKTFKKLKITAGYKVRGQYVLKNGGDDINKTDKVTMYIVKLNGNWVILTTKNGEKFRFDSEKKSYDKVRFLHDYINIFFENAAAPDMF
ncbi:MAG: hypothetical protein J5712_03165 [Lachnospiraceae bacterium]|nr:hypothetical protein [Lachnospiraceae bacterium]